MKKFLYALTMTVCIAVFLISAFMIGKYYYNSMLSQNEFDSLEELIVNEEDFPKKDDVNSNSNNIINAKEKYVISAKEKYGKIYEKNSDFAGWISIENTRVNYPVMQTKGNVDFYLKHNFEKEFDTHGVPYIDERCDIETSDNIVIYGHNMKDGSMFADVGKYKKEDYYKEHKLIKFDTLYEFGEYEIVAAFKISATAENPFKYYNFINAADEQEFDDFIGKCKKRSLYDTGVTAKYGDRLITLSTCEYSKVDGRFVIVAKRVG